MPKKIFVYFLIIFIALLGLINPTAVKATSNIPCSNSGIIITPSKSVYSKGEPIKLDLKIDQPYLGLLNPDWTYDVAFLQDGWPNPLPSHTNDFKGDRNRLPNSLSGDGLGTVSSYTLEFRTVGALGQATSICVGPKINILPEALQKTNCSLPLPENIQYKTTYVSKISVIPTDDKNVTFGAYIYKGIYPSTDFKADVASQWKSGSISLPNELLFDLNKQTLTITTSPLEIGANYTAVISAYSENIQYGCAVNYFTVRTDATSPTQNSSQSAPGAGASLVTPPSGGNSSSGTTPTGSSVNATGAECKIDLGGSGGLAGLKPGIETAIGCIPIEPQPFIFAVLRLAIVTGGAVTLLVLIGAVFKMITSAGNPDSLKQAQEKISSAIIGILFLVFSLLLLKIIGVDILGIPGFS